MALKKLCVFGHFGFGLNLLNGQTVKTRIVTEALEDAFGVEQVVKCDTHGGIKALFKLPFQVCQALKEAENILIFPAHNGLRVIAPLLSFFNRFHHRKLHYSVIGGWLPKFLEKRKGLTKRLKKFDGIYVETNTMRTALEKMGLDENIRGEKLSIAQFGELSELLK